MTADEHFQEAERLLQCTTVPDPAGDFVYAPSVADVARAQVHALLASSGCGWRPR